MTPDEKIRRGQRAAEILADDLVDEALSTMRANVTAMWKGSKIGQREERETLYFLNCAIEDFEAHFRELITSGKMAEGEKSRAEQERAAG